MTSIRTNTSALVGVQLLNAVKADLAATQDRISTGLKVAGPRDSAAIYTIAQNMRADIGGWHAAQQALARGSSALDVALTATGSINDLLVEIDQKVAAYQDISLDARSKAALRADIEALIKQIDQQSQGADFDGIKLLASGGHLGVVGLGSNSSYSLPASTLTPQSFATPMGVTSPDTSVSRQMVTSTRYTMAYSPLTPDSFATVMNSLAQGSFQGDDRTVVPGAGTAPVDRTRSPDWTQAGRVSVAVDSFTGANAIEIWANGVRVAATGQPPASGGAAVAAATAVSGQTVLSFDYDPATMPAKFDIVSATGSPWAVDAISPAPGTAVGPPSAHVSEVSSRSAATPLPSTPLAIETSGPPPGNGQATYTLDGGPTPGRVDMIFDGGLEPDTVDIYQGGQRVAGSGQAYVAGGAPVAAGQPIAGQSVISFDYDPAKGPITFKFNETTPDPTAAWAVGGLALQSPSAPTPSPSPTQTTQSVYVAVSQRSEDDLSGAPSPTPETASLLPGAASYTLNAGTNAGRVDMLFDAYADADTVEIYQNGVRVAASGQAYAPGGGAVGAGQPVTGQQVLSFDYDPARGQDLAFKFDAGDTDAGAGWVVGSLVLQDASAPVPSAGAVTSNWRQTAMIYPHYDLVRSPDGQTVQLAARDLSAAGLGLAVLDWSDPAAMRATVKAAIGQAQEAAQYFGTTSSLLDGMQAQTAKLVDTLSGGVGDLVDADMAKEAAHLQAQQVREQLAYQTLSIANGSAQWILKLFGQG